MSRNYVEEYRHFMSDEKNIMNCENCPENTGCDGFQYRLPCGQWNCWVELTTHAEEEEEEEMKRYAIYTESYEVKRKDWNENELWCCTEYADGTAPKLIASYTTEADATKALYEYAPDEVTDYGRFFLCKQTWVEEESYDSEIEEWCLDGGAFGKVETAVRYRFDD